MRKKLLYALYTIVVIFALIGVAFTAVFIGMRFGLFNVSGSIAERNQFFFLPNSSSKQQAAVGSLAPDISCTSGTAVCDWSETREWAVVAGGLEKDAALIARVSQETDVPAALIAAVVVPEQLRFFSAEREVFKRYFEPLKILGSLSQFSLGVSGIKQETANQVEENLKNSESLYFPGSKYASLISYPEGANHDAELYNRLTDSKNHYYSYLYTALLIKEIEAGWRKAGYPIDGRPEIIATLFNIGLENSHPNANPVAGGAAITVGGRTYAFGELSGLVYSSGALNGVLGTSN